jgi:septal ring factor EnvC (AmiA/AmiB activator)
LNEKITVTPEQEAQYKSLEKNLGLAAAERYLDLISNETYIEIEKPAQRQINMRRDKQAIASLKEKLASVTEELKLAKSKNAELSQELKESKAEEKRLKKLEPQIARLIEENLRLRQQLTSTLQKERFVS